ncbi:MULTISPECIES: NUDIX domain-containing protein [unclassified Rhodococcus (in: high G+C Gram-positive bacteria)]|uniref:NUDIX hydrolase n=1 Tax=Rhodococcus sp. SJ-3 TaxID=3454628 RepID=UPI003F7B139A
MTKASDKSSPTDIFAAGTLLWRPSASGVELAMVHRPRYDDWTLPKGKLDPGETAIIAALRETEEETGFRAELGRGLGRVTYPMPGTDQRKQVDYWTARCTSGEFVPNDEVDILRWVSPDIAFDELSYSMDHTVLRRFLELPPDTRTVLLVRHAKAGSRKDYEGDDRSRPLEEKGLRQAAALVPQLSAFGADVVFSADRTRCIETIEPLADHLDLDIALEPMLSEEDYAADPSLAHKRIADVIENGRVLVLCSQGGVIPGLLQWWSEQSGFDLPEGRTRKASTWVLSFHDGKLVAAEYLDTPFASDRP